jgi:BirA family transcriptional regulator, biotin operon repressor / biotin---[acetyl-CoA-carboxylase] ligase
LRSSRSDPALPPDLADALAAAHDRLRGMAARTLYFTTIGSTNDVAASIGAEPSAEGTVVIADAQTAGRGRRGRTWFSPPASGLYVSVVLSPRRSKVDPARATTLLTLAAGVALAEGLERATGLSPSIKWPNDLLVGRRKLAGILAETVAADDPGRPADTRAGRSRSSPPARALRDPMNVVLGYGINVGPMAYPPELRDRATSLETELGRIVDRTLVCVETLVALADRYRDLIDGQFDAILDAWRRRAPSHQGAHVSWDTTTGRQAGVTEGIDDNGALLVRVSDRVERIVAGEVTWI